MHYKRYLQELELINQEIVFFESVLERYDGIFYNPFGKNAKYRRALIRKIYNLEREIGVLNYQYHGDESFPNPVDFMQDVEDENCS